jgi:hypothetical protein
MARVTISNALVDSVNRNLKAFKQRELNQLHNPIMDGLSFSGNESFIQEHMWEGRLDLQSLLPQSWLYKGKREVGFQFNCTDMVSKIDWYETDARIEIDFTTHPVPRHMTESRQIIRVSPEVSAQYGMDKLIKYKADHEAIVERYRKVRQDVATFLNKCKSLNEALKLWPAIAAYVDKDYVEKVNEVKPKGERRISEAMDVLAKIDVDAVQATAVAARLANT